MRYGLTVEQLQEILSILKKYPKVTEAIIFGSRAMGNYKPGSDVDIALKGELTASDAATIKDDLEEETFLPFFFDVVAYNIINNSNLKEHIDTHGVKIYINEEAASIKDLLTKIDQTQKQINQYRPFEEPLLSQLKAYYRIGLTYSSNALEGNSLTETETKVVLEDGLTIGGKPLRDHLEAIGHSQAYDFMFSLIKNDLFTEQDILTLHQMFYAKIDEKQAGQYRQQHVFISGSQYSIPDWPDVPKLMKNWLQKLPKQRKELHPVEFAAQVHKEFVFIHPFIDGNGRLARLLTNLVLLQSEYLITIIPPISRTEYIASLEKAHEDDIDFSRFIAERVLETQKDYLRLLK